MLDAAVQVFSRRGYHAASVDEIAETAGISKPMVYAYIGTKEELFIACMRREGDRLVAAVTEAAAEGTSPDDQLWRGLRAFFAFVTEHRDGWRVLYLQARGQELFAGVLAVFRAEPAAPDVAFAVRRPIALRAAPAVRLPAPAARRAPRSGHPSGRRVVRTGRSGHPRAASRRETGGTWD